MNRNNWLCDWLFILIGHMNLGVRTVNRILISTAECDTIIIIQALIIDTIFSWHFSTLWLCVAWKIWILWRHLMVWLNARCVLRGVMKFSIIFMDSHNWMQPNVTLTPSLWRVRSGNKWSKSLSFSCSTAPYRRLSYDGFESVPRVSSGCQMFEPMQNMNSQYMHMSIKTAWSQSVQGNWCHRPL